jgi:hypothetical protein
MTTINLTERARTIIEEELGEFRAFAGLPVSDIEAMAERLTRALAPVLGAAAEPVEQRSAA